jgi:hypothetical protein
LKDHSSNKDVKTPTPRDLISTSTSIASTDSGDGISTNNKKQSSNSTTTSSKSKVDQVKRKFISMDFILIFSLKGIHISKLRFDVVS